MQREQPPYHIDAEIAACVERAYGIAVAKVTFLPIGYDPNAAVYRIDAHNDRAYFLKLTRGTIVPASLHIPRVLIDHGVANVLAPLRTMEGELWDACGDDRSILYPFISGDNAMKRGMSGDQWRTFGKALNAVHSSGMELQFANDIPHETFAAPAIGLVRAMQQQVQTTQFDVPVQQKLAAFWNTQAELIRHLTDRAEHLGTLLQTQQLPNVLCHGDIHAANIMIDNQDLYLVDWDTPRIAPRERDLLFVVGSPIARQVTPGEETLFFEGYGPRTINWPALSYYRYERALEDIYESGRSVFLNQEASLDVKEAEARLAIGLFQPDDIVDVAMRDDAV